MRCDETHEHFVDLIYEEGGAASSNKELQQHLLACSACRRELEELEQTREHLKEWKDESPLRSISIAKRESLAERRTGWQYLRYAAVAAMALICILALSNMEFTVNNSGFSIRTNLFRRDLPGPDYYTKSEVRDLVKLALDDTEMRINDGNRLLVIKMLDMLEQDGRPDMRLVRGGAAPGGNRN
jgi:hypothetical protein